MGEGWKVGRFESLLELYGKLNREAREKRKDF